MDALAAAETSVLGVCFLAQRDLVADIAQRLTQEDFSEHNKGLVFKGICYLVDRGEDINMISVLDVMQSNGVDVESPRGPNIDFLHHISNSVATHISYNSYIDVIRSGSKRRQAQSALAAALSELADHGCPVEDTIAGLVGKLSGEKDFDGVKLLPLSKAVEKAIKETEERFNTSDSIIGIKTGIEELDSLTGGLKPQRMYIVMGATGRGKTCLALNMVNSAIKAGNRVLHVSCEMSGSDLAKRFMAMRSLVDGKRIDNGDLGADELDKLLYAVKDLKGDGDKLQFIETRISSAQLRRELIKMNGDRRPQLLVVDYLQLMACEPAPTRQQQLQKLSADLLSIAIDFNLCIIALSQQNKDGQARESKDIENDASGIMKIEYEDVEAGPGEPAPNVFVNLTKHRFGDIGKARATFFRSHQLFVSRRDY